MTACAAPRPAGTDGVTMTEIFARLKKRSRDQRLQRRPERNRAASGRMAQQISGQKRAAAEARNHGRSLGHSGHLPRDGTRHRAARRQHRPGGRPDSVSWRSAAEPEADEPNPRRGCARHDHDRRSRRHAGRGAGRRRRGRTSVSAQPGLGRLLHHRRQYLHQCRRQSCAALWHDAGAGAGAGSGAGGRAGAAHAANACTRTIPATT